MKPENIKKRFVYTAKLKVLKTEYAEAEPEVQPPILNKHLDHHMSSPKYLKIKTSFHFHAYLFCIPFIFSIVRNMRKGSKPY
jgi:hypothetical protein